ncbi:MAG: FmdB family zinc ribbon protein [Gemmatimonadaceae bacterium]
MPTYEFRCPQGHEFEKFYRSISGAEARATCPQCGQPAERIMSPAGFAFKGSGFYLTDYGKNAHRGTEPASAGGAAAGDGASAESKGDAKRDAKTESKAETGTSGNASTSAGGSSPAVGGDAKPVVPKPAEAKPASPPKKSAGE